MPTGELSQRPVHEHLVPRTIPRATKPTPQDSKSHSTKKLQAATPNPGGGPPAGSAPEKLTLAVTRTALEANDDDREHPCRRPTIFRPRKHGRLAFVVCAEVPVIGFTHEYPFSPKGAAYPRRTRRWEASASVEFLLHVYSLFQKGLLTKTVPIPKGALFNNDYLLSN